jgi:hypothetical protein
MDSIRKLKIYNLLKGIETGNPDSVKVVNEQKYIQHNPQTKEGGSGLAEFLSSQKLIQKLKLFDYLKMEILSLAIPFITSQVNELVLKFLSMKVIKLSNIGITFR